MAKQKMIIIVGVDTDENQAGFGVMRQSSFKKSRKENLFDHLYNDGKCDTFHTFGAAMTFIAEAEGTLVDVFGAIAY